MAYDFEQALREAAQPFNDYSRGRTALAMHDLQRREELSDADARRKENRDLIALHQKNQVEDEERRLLAALKQEASARDLSTSGTAEQIRERLGKYEREKLGSAASTVLGGYKTRLSKLEEERANALADFRQAALRKQNAGTAKAALMATLSDPAVTKDLPKDVIDDLGSAIDRISDDAPASKVIEVVNKAVSKIQGVKLWPAGNRAARNLSEAFNSNIKATLDEATQATTAAVGERLRLNAQEMKETTDSFWRAWDTHGPNLAEDPNEYLNTFSVAAPGTTVITVRPEDVPEPPPATPPPTRDITPQMPLPEPPSTMGMLPAAYERGSAILPGAGPVGRTVAGMFPGAAQRLVSGVGSAVQSLPTGATLAALPGTMFGGDLSLPPVTPQEQAAFGTAKASSDSIRNEANRMADLLERMGIPAVVEQSTPQEFEMVRQLAKKEFPEQSAKFDTITREQMESAPDRGKVFFNTLLRRVKSGGRSVPYLPMPGALATQPQ